MIHPWHPSAIAPPADEPLPWSTAPFGAALRAALKARGMSYRDLESTSLVPVGNLHDHVSGKRRPPGDDLLRRIAAGLRVEPEHFREYRERRLLEALRDAPEVEIALSRRVASGTLTAGLTIEDHAP
ncbi:MAG: hypothetical protein AB1416_12715 [Actinomycetota bacterium]